MAFGGLLKKGFGSLVLLLCLAAPLSAQIEDQLSAYTGANATGYLQPLANAFGADLNSGIFRSASIPRMRPKIRLEFQVMSVLFGDDDKTFRAITERGFTPQTYANAPTVVGPEEGAHRRRRRRDGVRVPRRFRSPLLRARGAPAQGRAACTARRSFSSTSR